MIFKAKPTTLDVAIDDAVAQLNGISIETEEYALKMERVKELYALKEKTSPKRVDPNTIAVIAGNLATTLLVLNYERAHVITTKAIGYLLKTK